MRDAGGFTDITRLFFLVNNGTALGANVCHGYYDRAANALFLYNDSLTATVGRLRHRGRQERFPIRNAALKEQLRPRSGFRNRLDSQYRSASPGEFSGSPKNVYGWVVDAANTGSGWVQTSTWGTGGAVPQAPVVVSGTPSASTAGTQTFSLHSVTPMGSQT